MCERRCFNQTNEFRRRNTNTFNSSNRFSTIYFTPNIYSRSFSPNSFNSESDFPSTNFNTSSLPPQYSISNPVTDTMEPPPSYSEATKNAY